MAISLSGWRSVWALWLMALLLSACGGGGGGTSSTNNTTTPPAPGPVAAAANVLTMSFERWPSTAQINAPFVSVTVCVPGTSNCQTIDHVLLDTGSFGLRLQASALSLEQSLPVVNNAAGRPVGACGQFASGFTWGSVRRADVQLSGESASNLPIEIIGDTASVYAKTPSACSSTGGNLGASVASLGANGILGIGFLPQDCGTTCVTNATPGLYYACTGSTCTGTTLAISSQITNPITAFAQDNNGATLVVPNVALGSNTASLSGSLVFGVGTQTNNAISSSATVLPTDKFGYFTTVYQGTSYTSSFIDSGSNGIFFDDISFSECSGFYCPSSTQSLTAILKSPTGTNSRTVNFWIENIQDVPSDTVAAHVGGPSILSGTFDWGMPFFFGRTTHMVFSGSSTSQGTGPFWAY
mgnify:CR=1 FL=1